MSFRAYVIEPLQRFLGAVRPFFASLDAGLVALARPFGAGSAHPLKRYGLLLGAYAAIYLVALLPVPWLGLAVLLVGYLGVLAIGRAWAANEKQRVRIVRKLDNTDPDLLPDLRVSALLAAAQLLILFPLLFDTLHRLSPGLFTIHEGARDRSLAAWFAFTLDAVSRTLIDWLGWKGLAEGVGPGSVVGGYLILAARTTIDLLLVQGAYRVLAIRSLVEEAVSALKQDPDITRRLGRRAVGPLLTILRGPDKDRREKAALVLGELKAASAVEGLIAALDDEEPDVRWRAATALGQIGDARAVEPLVGALRSPAESVRSAALHALGSLKSADALASLRELLQESDPGARAAAVEALGQMQGAEVVDALLAALGDTNEEVRKAAVVALGRRKELRAGEPLIQVLAERTNPAWLRGEAARALGQIAGRAAVPELMRGAADEDAFVRKCSASALGGLGDESAVPALLPLLEAPEKDVREAGAAALGKLKAREAVPNLLPLLGGPDEAVRQAAGQALGEIADPGSVEALAQVLRDGIAGARQVAAEVLGKMGGARAVSPLSEALGRDADKEVRETAAWALGQLGDARALGPLREATKDAEKDVRDAAEEALKTIETKEGAR